MYKKQNKEHYQIQIKTRKGVNKNTKQVGAKKKKHTVNQ